MTDHSEVERLKEYYARTANTYESTCCFNKNDEHYFTCAALVGLLSHYEVDTFLDVGCGTGRAIQYLQPKCPQVRFTGLEPVPELRSVAMANGLSPDQISDGDATKLDYPSDSVDCVAMFGILHHIPNPVDAIKEAMRVSRKIVCFSDHNIYGMGSWKTRFVKQSFRDFGMKGLLKLIMTKGKGYHDTDWDGIFYPFSLVDYLPLIQAEMEMVYSFSTKTPAINLYRNASHLTLMGVKKQPE